MVLSNLLGWESANHRSVAAAKHKLVPHLSNSTTVQWYCRSYSHNWQQGLLACPIERPASSVLTYLAHKTTLQGLSSRSLRKIWPSSGQFPKKSKNYNVSHFQWMKLYVESIIVTSLHFPSCSHPQYSQRYNSVIASDWSGTVFVYTNHRSSVFSTLDLKHSQSNSGGFTPMPKDQAAEVEVSSNFNLIS